MSIVANYARLSEAQVANWIESPSDDPEAFVRQLPDAEFIDIDQAWSPMAWLVSSTKRMEDEHNWRVMSDPSFTQSKPGLISRLFGSRPGRTKAVIDSLARLDSAVIDAPLTAIEGRSDHREEQLDFGMGGAAIFQADEVKALSDALEGISPDQVRSAVDPELMDRMGVFPGTWLEEGNELLEEYILPNLERLKTFYRAASGLRQSVVMWYR